jgi:hypothetical protein
MPRLYRKAIQPNHKICNRCNTELPATPEMFVVDKTRLDGLAYECRECHRERKKGRDKRTDRWANLTDEQKSKVKARQRRYNATSKGRAISLKKAYERIDECDFTSDELTQFLLQPCVHCGTTDLPRGLDRIDNVRGHTKDNVAPSCAPCNFARGDRFSFEEMQLIGAVIREIFANRKSSPGANQGGYL